MVKNTKLSKFFISPNNFTWELTQAGFQADVKVTDNYLIYATGTKLAL